MLYIYIDNIYIFIYIEMIYIYILRWYSKYKYVIYINNNYYIQ